MLIMTHLAVTPRHVGTSGTNGEPSYKLHGFTEYLTTLAHFENEQCRPLTHTPALSFARSRNAHFRPVLTPPKKLLDNFNYALGIGRRASESKIAYRYFIFHRILLFIPRARSLGINNKPFTERNVQVRLHTLNKRPSPRAITIDIYIHYK